MDLVGRASCLQPLQQLGLEIGKSSGCRERDEQILVALDAVRYAARLDHARPANDARHTYAAFPGGSLLAAERCIAAVGPKGHLITVIGGVDDDRIVSNAQALQLLQQ